MRPQSSLLDGRDSLRGTDDIAPRRSHAHPSLRQARHSRLEAGQEQHATAVAPAEEVNAPRARLAGALQITRQTFQRTRSLLRQALHSGLSEGQKQREARQGGSCVRRMAVRRATQLPAGWP